MEKSVPVDGLKIRYLEEGSGHPAILLHGASLGSSADVWEKSLSALSRGGFRALAYDQPGFGLSDNPADYTLSYRTRFIVKFMDALGIERASLIGHSQAGGMAARVALDHPERVSHVVTAGTGSLLPPLPDQGARGGAREGEEGGETPPTLEGTKKLLESNLFNKSLITPDVLEKRHWMSVGKNFEAFRARSQARESQKDAVPLWQRLKQIHAPLLMLYGAQDRGSAAKRCALFKQMEPAMNLQVIDNACHLLMWDAAETFQQKLIEFLRRQGESA
ncbi:MAG: alpha/beta fold hydrolase [Candidatus Binatia bacterium]